MENGSFFKKHSSVILFFALLAVVYLIIFALLCSTPVYNIETGHNDRLFSADDVYYVKNFYSVNMDTSPRVIKHPLFIVFAHLFTLAELFVFGEISIASHYKLIAAFQMAIAVISVWYLFLILDRQYKLKRKVSLLFCGIYSFAFSTLFYTFIAESYIFSSLILLMTYYYARENNFPVTVILGALAAGITITNAALWAAIVFFSGGNIKDRLVTLVSGGVLFCLLVAILPIRNGFFSYILPGSLSSAENYSDSFGILQAAVYTFFAFFGSTVFYLDTMDVSAFREFKGDALTFIPSASIPVVIISLCWLILLIFTAAYCRKEKMLIPPLAVLGLNLLLHGLIQYGLKEAFLYSLHHFTAQILIIALLFCPDMQIKKAYKKSVLIFLALFLVCTVLLNIPGYMEIASFITK